MHADAGKLEGNKRGSCLDGLDFSVGEEEGLPDETRSLQRGAKFGRVAGIGEKAARDKQLSQQPRSLSIYNRICMGQES